MTVLQNEHPGGDHFQHEAECRDSPGQPPHVQPVGSAPDAEMDARPFHGRAQPRQCGSAQRKGSFEPQWADTAVGRKERERNHGDVALLAPHTRPEGGIHQGCDVSGVRHQDGRGVALRAGRFAVPQKVLVHAGGDGLRGGVRRYGDRWVGRIA